MPDLESAEGQPWVCPGCYAVNSEPCAPYCIDLRIQRAREEDARYGDESEWGFDSDWEGEDVSPRIAGIIR